MSTIGAIRFNDMFASPDLLVGDWKNQIGGASNRWFEPPEWHYRIPFWGRVAANGELDLYAGQAQMDLELALAESAGIDYFAHDVYTICASTVGPYGTSGSVLTGLDDGYSLHLSSAHKARVKHCPILVTIGPADTQWDDVVDQLLVYLSDSAAMYVLGRPLMYWYQPHSHYPVGSLGGFSSLGAMQAGVATFRAAVIAAGLPNPYIVCMTGDPSQGATNMTNFGFDALGAYVVPTFTGGIVELTYAQLCANHETWRNTVLGGTSFQIVPPMATGWDRRELDSPNEPYYVPGTPAELVAEIAALKAFIDANPSRCEAQTLTIDAWNEVGEGSYLVPTAGDPGKRLEAMGMELRPYVALS